METYDKDIREWISGYSSDDTDLTIPIASFPELSTAEANTTTGDFANLLYAFMHEFHAVWATIPTAERPVNMYISKGVSPNITNNTQTVSFSARFTIAGDPGALNVVAEPVPEA